MNVGEGGFKRKRVRIVWDSGQEQKWYRGGLERLGELGGGEVCPQRPLPGEGGGKNTGGGPLWKKSENPTGDDALFQSSN